jgi:hypothetical protein
MTRVHPSTVLFAANPATAAATIVIAQPSQIDDISHFAGW